MAISLLDKTNTGLVILDVQERLMRVMGHKERVVDNIVKLLHLAKLFGLPVILTEQNPRWLGPTLPSIKASLKTYEPIDKMEFNCCDVEAFKSRLESEGLKNIILTGVETHICILQTCLGLLDKGYRVHVPHFAVDSRREDNWDIGLALMRDAGAAITSTETIIFQILERAGTKEFKEMLGIVK